VVQSSVSRSVVGSNPTCGANLGKYSSGSRGAPAKGIGRLRGARVQIPPSPPLHYLIWPVGQAVKTSPFHGGITGSSPVRVIMLLSCEKNIYLFSIYRVSFLVCSLNLNAYL